MDLFKVGSRGPPRPHPESPLALQPKFASSCCYSTATEYRLEHSPNWLPVAPIVRIPNDVAARSPLGDRVAVIVVDSYWVPCFSRRSLSEPPCQNICRWSVHENKYCTSGFGVFTQKCQIEMYCTFCVNLLPIGTVQYSTDCTVLYVDERIEPRIGRFSISLGFPNLYSIGYG